MCSLHTFIYRFHNISSTLHRKGPGGACWPIALSIKCLMCITEDLGSIPSTGKKSQARVACTSNSGTGERDR